MRLMGPALAVLLAMMTAAPSPGPDLGGALRFKSPDRCEFDARGEAMFKRMLHADPHAGRLIAAPTVKIGDRSYPVQYEDNVEPKSGADWHTYITTVDLPSGAHWNGLQLRRIRSEAFVPADVDGEERRSFQFENSLDEVRAALRRAGLDFATGTLVWIDKPISGCLGQIELSEERGRTTMLCSWGC